MLRQLRALFLTTMLLLAGQAVAAQNPLCHGRWMNPITDICWSCMFPMTIGMVPVVPIGPPDYPSNPPIPFCMCSKYRYGVTVGFWEPTRVVEVVKTPWCMPTLGGLSFPVGWSASHGALETKTVSQKTSRGSYYQAHFLEDAVLIWMELLTDSSCAAGTGHDVLYMTEFDPLWNDDKMTAILHPENILFSNTLAIAACAVDCVMTSVGALPLEPLFWCSGCQGGVYPVDGHAPYHDGGVRTAALIAHRMILKMHREMVAWQYWSPMALCGPFPNPLLEKGAYRTQLIYPVPATSQVLGQCCQPLGASTLIYGAGKEFPVLGEDYAFAVFHKRNCCAY